MKRVLVLSVFVLASLAFVDAANAQLCMPGSPGCAAGGGGGVAVDVDTILDAQFCVDSVGSDAYACSSSVCPAAIANGQSVIFQAGTLNTGAATFAFCGQAAKAVVRVNNGISTVLVTGDILAKQPVGVVYNATDDNWKMTSMSAATPSKGDNQTFTGGNTFTNTTTMGLVFQYGFVEAVTTTKTPAATEGNETYTNTGDTDGSTITLLDNPVLGASWNFAITTAQTMTIVPSAGETLVHLGVTCGTSLTSNTVGSTITIRTVVGGSGGVFYTFAPGGTWVCTP